MSDKLTLHEFQSFLRAIVGEHFAEATNHPYTCTCDKCREWWVQMGPEDEGVFGPFGDQLWEEFAAQLGVTVAEAKAMHEEVEND
jgi:hypothetical protein